MTVSLAGPVAATATTDADGNYLFDGLPDGSYTVSLPGGDPASRAVTVARTAPWGRTSFVVP